MITHLLFYVSCAKCTLLPILASNMPNWSYIPYTFMNEMENNYLIKEPVACFHPLFAKAAYNRICRELSREFHDITNEKLYFLQRMMDGILRNKHGQQAYLIVLESFGKPLFAIRNLAHTLQDPVERGVYVIHLEDALHVWRQKREEGGTCWEALVFVGIVGLIGFTLNSISGPWISNIRPHALMNFFSSS
jgi:hypothetical protein